MFPATLNRQKSFSMRTSAPALRIWFRIGTSYLGVLKVYFFSIQEKSSSSQTNATSCFTVSTHSTISLAPEGRISGSKFTQKCDVYSFGIVLMEILTGKLPDEGPENGGKGLESLVRKTFREERPVSEIIDPALLQEVYAKKQVVEAFHIARNCTELDPELRPRMKTVSDSLDRIKFQL